MDLVLGRSLPGSKCFYACMPTLATHQDRRAVTPRGDFGTGHEIRVMSGSVGRLVVCKSNSGTRRWAARFTSSRRCTKQTYSSPFNRTFAGAGMLQPVLVVSICDGALPALSRGFRYLSTEE